MQRACSCPRVPCNVCISCFHTCGCHVCVCVCVSGVKISGITGNPRNSFFLRLVKVNRREREREREREKDRQRQRQRERKKRKKKERKKVQCTIIPCIRDNRGNISRGRCRKIWHREAKCVSCVFQLHKDVHGAYGQKQQNNMTYLTRCRAGGRGWGWGWVEREQSGGRVRRVHHIQEVGGWEWGEVCVCVCVCVKESSLGGN